MFRRLLLSSFSLVMRHPVDSGIQVCPSRDSGRFGPSDSGSNTSPHVGHAQSSQREQEPLLLARMAFIDTLADIRTQQAGDLLRRVRLAQSLRELWFLRAEVFSLVAHHRDQREAGHRLAVLATHFPRPPAGRSTRLAALRTVSRRPSERSFGGGGVESLRR